MTGPFQVRLGRAQRMQHDAERQPAIDAQRVAAGFVVLSGMEFRCLPRTSTASSRRKRGRRW